MPGMPVAADALRDEISKLLWRREQRRFRFCGRADGRGKEQSVVQAFDAQQSSVVLITNSSLDLRMRSRNPIEVNQAPKVELVCRSLTKTAGVSCSSDRS